MIIIANLNPLTAKIISIYGGAIVIISWDCPPFFENLDASSNLHIHLVQIKVLVLQLQAQFLDSVAYKFS